MSRFDHQIVLITGATAGLGLHLCQAFGEGGALVIAVARGSAGLQQTRTALEHSQIAVHTIAADVTQPDQVASMVVDVEQRFGRLDVLVNNVGRSSRGWASETPPEAFREAMELNLITAVHCVRATLPLLEASRGHIVNIGSLASKFATPVLGPYPAAKFALAAYTQQLRLELRSRGIHVMLVCPGPIRRADAGHRYAQPSASTSPAASGPGGGAKLKQLDPQRLARAIVRGCQRRQAELVLPTQARLLALIQQWNAKWGDWILARRS